MTNKILHDPVLLQESIEGLALKADGIYIDATFGRGGHSQAILAHLNASGMLLAFDKDPEAVAYAEHLFANEPRFSIYHDSFAALEHVVKKRQLIGKINGILFDLGLSSPQLDTAARGFSFLQEGPLDMRMNPKQASNAADWINRASVMEMSEVFREYGEERFAKRIANKIAAARAETPIKTTLQLANIIKEANPAWEKHKHPATRCFQAIRIFINQELSELQQALATAYAVLAPQGRLVAISFHSLEDRIVKRFLRKQQKGQDVPAKLPIRAEQIPMLMKSIGKAIKPSTTEIARNPRARSAILRIGEKIQ